MSNASETILIEYGVILNGRENGGWLPYIKENGRVACSTWSPSEFSKVDAAAMAKLMADSRADRFVGDWDIQLVDIGLVQ